MTTIKHSCRSNSNWQSRYTWQWNKKFEKYNNSEKFGKTSEFGRSEKRGKIGIFPVHSEDLATLVKSLSLYNVEVKPFAKSANTKAFCLKPWQKAFSLTIILFSASFMLSSEWIISFSPFMKLGGRVIQDKSENWTYTLFHFYVMCSHLLSWNDLSQIKWNRRRTDSDKCMNTDLITKRIRYCLFYSHTDLFIDDSFGWTWFKLMLISTMWESPQQ